MTQNYSSRRYRKGKLSVTAYKSGEKTLQFFSKFGRRIKGPDEFIRSMLDYARINRIEIAHE